MSNISFDPYYRWLAIRPEEQPPNHYRLLGVAPFESDLDVISTAADQRMAHVRSFQNGPHAAVSQRVLNEITAARLCLLNAGRKAKYDQALQKAVSYVSPSSSAEQSKPSLSSVDKLASGPSGVEPADLSAARTLKKAKGLSRVAVIAGASAVLVAAIIAWMSRGGHPPEVHQRPVPSQAAVESPVVAPKEEPPQPVKLPERPVVERPKVEVIDTKPAESAKPVARAEPVQVAMAEEQKREESKAHQGTSPSERSPRPVTGSRSAGEGSHVRHPQEEAQEWVDLLAGIELGRDRVAGEWHKEEGELTSSDGEFVRVVSPVEVSGSYDLKVAFTRNKGNNAIGILLPVGERACAVILSGWNGAICGIELIDGRASNANPTTNRSVKIATGRMYDLLAKVRLQKQLASIEVYLDGVRILQWQGNESSLGLYGAWRLPQAGRIGLGSHQSTTFHSAKVRMDADKPAISEEVKVAKSMAGSKPSQAKAGLQSEGAASSMKAAATKESSEDHAALLTKKELVGVLNLLKKELHGRVSYDRQDEQFVLTYDWTNRLQWDDFKTKAKLSFVRGRLVLEAGESVTCVVPFKEVTISTSVLVPQMKGTMIKTSGGAHAYVGGATVDTIYLESGEGGRPYLVVPKPQRTGVQPLQVTVTGHRLGVAYGIGEPSRIGKPVSNFYAGKVMLFGGDLGYQYGKLVLTGTIDERWLKSLRQE